MLDKTVEPAALPAGPVGTPPEGGRWTWVDAWVRLPETDEAAAPAAAAANTTPKE